MVEQTLDLNTIKKLVSYNCHLTVYEGSLFPTWIKDMISGNFRMSFTVDGTGTSENEYMDDRIIVYHNLSNFWVILYVGDRNFDESQNTFQIIFMDPTVSIEGVQSYIKTEYPPSTRSF